MAPPAGCASAATAVGSRADRGDNRAILTAQERCPIRAFEILGIVLFRFRPLPRLWAIVLIAVNAASLLFVHTIYGQANLVAVLAAIGVMAVIYARLGFVRLLGIGHAFWIPMLIGFALHMPDPDEQPWLYYWVVSLMVCNTISLVVDAVDAARFFAGDRQPHYNWRAAGE